MLNLVDTEVQKHPYDSTYSVAHNVLIYADTFTYLFVISVWPRWCTCVHRVMNKVGFSSHLSQYSITLYSY